MTGYLRTLFWIGVVLLFLPYFGIPNTFKVCLAIALGIVVIFISFAIRKKVKALRLKLRRFEAPVVDTAIHTDTFDHTEQTDEAA